MLQNSISNQSIYSNQNLIGWFNRIALALVFIWFGFLKITHTSPATELVRHLHKVMLAQYIPFTYFLTFLGYMECIIGVLWLVPRFTKTVGILFFLQMSTAFLPLIYLPDETWQQSFVLTLEGQYIIKNVVLLASAATIFLLACSKPK